MQHGFRELDWVAYLDGRLSAEASAGIDRHLAVCAECADFVKRSRAWEEQLALEVSAIGPAQFASAERVEELLLSALERISHGGQARIRPSGAVLLLRRLLEPLLGRRAAQGFIDLAMGRLSLTEAADLEPRTWPLFVEYLGVAAGSVGGTNTQRMIARAGAQLSAEMV